MKFVEASVSFWPVWFTATVQWWGEVSSFWSRVVDWQVGWAASVCGVTLQCLPLSVAWGTSCECTEHEVETWSCMRAGWENHCQLQALQILSFPVLKVDVRTDAEGKKKKTEGKKNTVKYVSMFTAAPGLFHSAPVGSGAASLQNSFLGLCWGSQYCQISQSPSAFGLILWGVLLLTALS